VQSVPPNKVPQWISNVEPSKVKSKKAASCPKNRRQSSISGPWSFEWIKYHHLGDVGLNFSQERKDRVNDCHLFGRVCFFSDFPLSSFVWASGYSGGVFILSVFGAS
jgi:hypothetical protein